MDIHELQKLKSGDSIKNSETKEEYQIIMKFQYSVNCFLGSGKAGHIRISELNMNQFEKLPK